MKEFDKKLRNMHSRIVAKLDPTMKQAKDVYKSLDAGDRQKLKAWIDKLADVKPPEDIPFLIARSHIEILIEEGEEVASVKLTAEAAKRATDAWNEKKGYVPTWRDQ